MSLRRKFEQGEFAILAEMEPPKGVDVAMMLANAKRVKDKVDAFVVPEMSNAVMRISSLGGALILQQDGMDTVLQLCCRDRNRLALQGDLLAAYACGIRNVMAVSGEDPSFGDHHQARPVYDINLIELLQAVQKLQQGRDMAGVELAGTPRFLVGSTSDAGAKGKSPEIESEEIGRRTEAGAQFFITPPLFDPDLLQPFTRRIDTRRSIIVPTVLLLKSLGMARYIQTNMKHIHIPDAVIERLQRAPDKVRECIRIAADLVTRIKAAGFSGVMLSTIGWEHKLPDIIDGV
jgi:methylenetetrahydrofolate reductase (NADPH)